MGAYKSWLIGSLVNVTINEEELQALLDEERQRIARDLHDLVLQRLFATGIMLEGALRKAIVQDVQIALKQALIDLDETVGQIRSTVHSLSNNKNSVRQKIIHEIEVARSHWGYVIDFNLKGPIDTVIPPKLSDDVIAVTAELLHNAGRHAKATKVKYEINVESTSLVIKVEDNGDGFKPIKFGNGLLNLSDRANKYGGEIRVDNLDRGLRIIWQVAI